MIVYLYFQIPLMLLVMLPAVDGLKPEWREAAANLGGTAATYWRRVGIPVLAPAALGGMLLLFANAFAAYATAFALTTGASNLVPLQIRFYLQGNAITGKQGLGYALAAWMILIMLVTMGGVPAAAPAGRAVAAMSAARSGRGGAVSSWAAARARRRLLPPAAARAGPVLVPARARWPCSAGPTCSTTGRGTACSTRCAIPASGRRCGSACAWRIGAIVLTLGLLLPTALWVHLRAPSARGLVEVLSVLPYVVPPIALVVGVTGAFRDLAPWFIRSDLCLIPFYTLLAMPFTYRALDAGLTCDRPAHARRRVALARRRVDDDDVPGARAQPGQRPDLVGLPHGDGRARRVHHRQPAAQGDAARRSTSSSPCARCRAASPSACCSCWCPRSCWP